MAIVDLYESFDADWPTTNLFRDLIVVDSIDLLEYLHRYQPLHIAALVCSIVDAESKQRLEAVLRLASSAADNRRYARVIVGTYEVRSKMPELLQTVVGIRPDLVDERRLFVTVFRTIDSGIEGVFRAIGSAQPVSRAADGSVEFGNVQLIWPD